MLQCKYTKAIDIWAAGCIFVELLSRKPMFPGTDTQQQLELVLDFLGTPSEEEIEKIPRGKREIS